MLFSLDIIWISEEMKIIQIDKNLPPCQDKFCSSVEAEVPAKYTLEINSGFSDLMSFAVGDLVQINKS